MADQAKFAELAMEHMKKRVGYSEQPPSSNSDKRPDGIRVAQEHTAGGGAWLRGQAWCGCWCFYALETAHVAGIDCHLASVAQIEETAKRGQKCYRGWTTDHARVQRGDLAIIGGYGVHVEMVRGFDGANTLTYGGNTSPGRAGSQANGGGAFERVRSPRHPVRAAVVTSSVACFVDYCCTPERFTPGFEKRLSRWALFSAYVAVAAGLAASTVLTSRRERT
jgi:hypothetical protein